MPTYFKPLRRKIGVLLLVIAIRLTGMWIESVYCLKYEFTFPLVVIEISIRSIYRVLSFEILKRYRPANEFPVAYNVSYFEIQHFWVVVPLTLLSAWLLLSKPRAVKTTEKQGSNF